MSAGAASSSATNSCPLIVSGRGFLPAITVLQIGAALPTVACMAIQVAAFTGTAEYLRTHVVSWGVEADNAAITKMAHTAVLNYLVRIKKGFKQFHSSQAS
jgi:hypothetical protein